MKGPSLPSGLTRGFWLRVMNELKNRGVDDLLLAVYAKTIFEMAQQIRDALDGS